MKRWQSIIALILGLICVALSALGVVGGIVNQKLQAQLQQQQLEINKGEYAQQVGTNVIREVASKALKNDNLRKLLMRNGFTVTETATAPQAPSPSPTPKR
jgi:signal transduction histidine kinase